MLHLHIDTATGVACIRKWNICDLIHLLCLHTLVTWVFVMPSGSHRTVLINSLYCLSTHLGSTNPECSTKDFIFMKHKLEAGSDKLWKSDKLSCGKPYTLDCVFCVGWGPNESVSAFFLYGKRICVQDFTHILQSVNHNWDKIVTRWYNQWEWERNSIVNATY